VNKEKADFDFDAKRINWRMYSMNHAFGIKRYVLQEDAVVPSLGYDDVTYRMK
jgi:hypothetical protein